jgi:hypothetical protein
MYRIFIENFIAVELFKQIYVFFKLLTFSRKRTILPTFIQFNTTP